MIKLGLIKIYRNEEAFAKIDWLLYKFFKKKRIYPCGRTKETKYRCCCLTPNNKNSLIVEDGHRVICKVCGSTHSITNRIITDIEEEWKENFIEYDKM